MSPDTNNWLAAYLYYAEPWEPILTHAVKPFVEETFKDGLAEQFFFIRYWERGPHLRLRFKGEEDVLEKMLKPRLESFFNDYLKRNPSKRIDPESIRGLPKDQSWLPNNSIQFMPYHPEIKRYGGPIGITIAEKQFHTSSLMVLEILGQNIGWSYDRALGVALQLHLGFVFSLRMTLIEIQQLFSYISDWWLFGGSSSADLQTKEYKERKELLIDLFEKKYNDQKISLLTHIQKLWGAFGDGVEFEQGWLNDWLSHMATIGEELRIALRENKLVLLMPYSGDSKTSASEENRQLWPILESYIHMTNNRLGILNRDEGYLGYLINKCVGHL